MAEQKLNTAQQEALDKMRDAKTREKEAAAGAPTPERPINTPKKYAKGGSIRGHGCETKGKTKGRFV
jgi:hypothetical protein